MQRLRPAENLSPDPLDIRYAPRKTTQCVNVVDRAESVEENMHDAVRDVVDGE
jgi:hypothetical protein